MKVSNHGTTGELVRFLGVGIVSVLVDFAVYTGLFDLGVQANPAKAGGFIAGTIFAYFANRIFTFRASGGSTTVVRFVLAYALGFGVNVFGNAAFLWSLGTQWPNLQIAFLGATALSTTSNFLMMKFFVFTGSAHSGSSN